MKDEIKEILNKLLEYFKESNINDFGYEKDKLISYEEAQILLDYITNLQEQLHQASLDIQELTEKDIGCPSWCDKLTNLQEENERLKETIENLTTMTVCGDRTQIKNTAQYKLDIYKQRNEKALNKIQYIIDYGFDYDGLNAVESLKGLIDMLVDYAIKSRNILNGGDE